jgi:hypothetical protein
MGLRFGSLACETDNQKTNWELRAIKAVFLEGLQDSTLKTRRFTGNHEMNTKHEILDQRPTPSRLVNVFV